MVSWVDTDAKTSDYQNVGLDLYAACGLSLLL